MPTYLYQCPECGEFEDVHKMADHESNMPCPKCRLEARQLINFRGAIKESTSPAWIVGGLRDGHPWDREKMSRSAFAMLAEPELNPRKCPNALVHPEQIDTREKYKNFLLSNNLRERHGDIGKA